MVGNIKYTSKGAIMSTENQQWAIRSRKQNPNAPRCINE